MKYGTESCVFTDELRNDFDVTYDLEGEWVAASDDDPGCAPLVVLRSIELSGSPIPVTAFSSTFISVLMEHCIEHAHDNVG